MKIRILIRLIMWITIRCVPLAFAIVKIKIQIFFRRHGGLLRGDDPLSARWPGLESWIDSMAPAGTDCRHPNGMPKRNQRPRNGSNNRGNEFRHLIWGAVVWTGVRGFRSASPQLTRIQRPSGTVPSILRRTGGAIRSGLLVSGSA